MGTAPWQVLQSHRMRSSSRDSEGAERGKTDWRWGDRGAEGTENRDMSVVTVWLRTPAQGTEVHVLHIKKDLCSRFSQHHSVPT